MQHSLELNVPRNVSTAGRLSSRYAAGVAAVVCTSAAAETPRLSVAEADDPCARYAGVYVSETEKEPEVKDEGPGENSNVSTTLQSDMR
jgi:hypothetical protein